MKTDLSFFQQIAWGLMWFLVFCVGAILLRWTIHRILSRARLAHPVITLASQSLFFILLIIGVITGLGTMGVNVSALVASLGLGGFALGFALRDMVSNVLAGVLILVYQPFQVGQHVSVAGFEGTVSEINLRYTILKTETARLLVPNQLLFTNPVKVQTGRDDKA